MHSIEKRLKLMEGFDVAGLILNNENKPVVLGSYIRELKKSQRIRDCYAINAQFWLEKYKRLVADEKEKNVFLNKYFQMLQVASFFDDDEYPELIKVIGEFEDFIGQLGIALK